MSSVLTLDLLKSFSDKPALQCESVPVYELGAGMVAWIAELDANEVDDRIDRGWSKFKEGTGQTDNVGFRAWVSAACLCGSQQRDFLAKDHKAISEAAALLGKQGRAVTRLWQMAAKLNGLTDEEEPEKNSPPASAGNGT